MNRNIAKRYASILITFLATCQAMGQSADEYRSLTIERAQHREGTAIYHVERCPSMGGQQEAAAILAPLAAIGAKFLTITISGVLAKRAEGLSGEFLARGLVSSGFRQGQCLVIVRGLFGELQTVDARGREIARPGVPSSSTLGRMGLAEYPAFYLEMMISNDADRWTLTPILIVYAATSAERRGDGMKHVSVAIALSDTSLENSEDLDGEETFATFNLDLGKLEIGKYYEGESILSGTAAVQTVSEMRADRAFSVTALVTETEDASLAIQALTQAFEDKKTDFEEALASSLGDLLGLDQEDEEGGADE